jgi:hypothetical protein
MSVFKRISKSDVVTVPYVANKQWDFSYLNINSSSIYIYTGLKMTGSFDPSTDPMTVNSQYKRLIYENVNQQFYNQYSGSLLDTGSLSRGLNYEAASSYIASNSFEPAINISYGSASFPQGVGDTIAVLSIPPKIYGDSLAPGSFVLSSSAYYITDDKNGNLKDSDTLVGNIFYEQGLAIITNQSYQTYFEDTSTTVLNWSNASMPNNYFIDSNLKIAVNGEEKTLEYNDNRGRFTLNVGDSVYVETWSDGTWPTDGTASLQLSITGQPTLNTSQSGAYLTSSFTVANQTPIYVAAYTAYTPDTQPYTILYNLEEYTQTSGSLLIDARLKILSANLAVTYLDVTGSLVGSVTIPADQNLSIEVQSDTRDNTGSVWGPYVTASLGYHLKQGTTTIASSSQFIAKNSGIVSASVEVDLDPGTTYTLSANTKGLLLPVDPATINWNLTEYMEPGVFLDANLRIQQAGGGTVFLDQFFTGTGSIQVPANTNIQLYAYSFTNDNSASIWNNYVSASLTANITQSGVIISSGSGIIVRNGGTMDATAAPIINLTPGGIYQANVQTTPTLIPISMSFSSAATGSTGTYIENTGVFTNGVTPEWQMKWDRTLSSGEIQPEDSTYAPFGYNGTLFTAKSRVTGPTTDWGGYTQCDTVVNVYEDSVLIRTASASLNSTAYPSSGSWQVEASVTFTPNSGSVYILNSFNTNLRSGYYTYNLGYDATVCNNACDNYSLTPITVYSNVPSLTVGSSLYTDTALTTPVTDGKYSDGTTCNTVVSGLITLQAACPIFIDISMCASQTADGGGNIGVNAYATTPVNTDVTAYFIWQGDLGSLITGEVVIPPGSSCGSVTFSGANAGENVSVFMLDDVIPNSNGNQTYNQGTASTAAVCVSC